LTKPNAPLSIGNDSVPSICPTGSTGRPWQYWHGAATVTVKS
jgi:hypothetical protein